MSVNAGLVRRSVTTRESVLYVFVLRILCLFLFVSLSMYPLNRLGANVWLAPSSMQSPRFQQVVSIRVDEKTCPNFAAVSSRSGAHFCVPAAWYQFGFREIKVHDYLSDESLQSSNNLFVHIFTETFNIGCKIWPSRGMVLGELSHDSDLGLYLDQNVKEAFRSSSVSVLISLLSFGATSALSLPATLNARLDFCVLPSLSSN
ncbi:hypothetical protein BJ166DRAFT_525792 [Pestalotiopsis sp. NC0098]|nr:hypothetical protein BJ166DRAFT_525792 [Pestalotiopsis sp. NC0098]